MRQRPFQQIAHILLLAAAYFISGRLGLMLPAFGSNITLLWLPTGIAVAALLRFGFAGWPGISLGAVAVNLAVGSPGPVALGIAVGNTCGPWLAAWVLQRMRFHPAFDRSRDILLLAVAGALGMLVSSSLGVATLTLAGVLPPGAREQAWLTWWAGDALGVIAAAPLVLTFTPVEVRAILRRRLEFLSWLVATCLTTWAAFVLNRGGPGQALAVAFTPLPFVAWAALRFGPVGTSLWPLLSGQSGAGSGAALALHGDQRGARLADLGGEYGAPPECRRPATFRAGAHRCLARRAARGSRSAHHLREPGVHAADRLRRSGVDREKLRDPPGAGD
jgi:integral membrane sensor domain MASE1